MTAPIRNSPQNQSPRDQPGGRRAPRLGTGIPSSENSFERRKRKSTPMPEQQAKRTKSCQISVKDKNSTTDSIGHNFNNKNGKGEHLGILSLTTSRLRSQRILSLGSQNFSAPILQPT